MSIPKALRRLVQTVNTRITLDEFIPSSELEALYQALGEHLGRPTHVMTTKQHMRLWDAINEYSTTVGGNPAMHVYGNIRRMTVVSKVEDVLRELRVDWRQGQLAVDFIVGTDGTVTCACCGAAFEPSTVNEHRCERPES